MKFERDGTEISVAEAMKSANCVTFQTGTIVGKGTAVQKQIEVPNAAGPPLCGATLVRQLQQWAEYGCMESSVPDAIKQLNSHPNWLHPETGILKDTYFVLLGATSAMGEPNKPVKCVCIFGVHR